MMTMLITIMMIILLILIPTIMITTPIPSQWSAKLHQRFLGHRLWRLGPGHEDAVEVEGAQGAKSRHLVRHLPPIREVGGAPRNPSPRNHFLVCIVKPSGCHCTDAFGEKEM